MVVVTRSNAELGVYIVETITTCGVVGVIAAAHLHDSVEIHCEEVFLHDGDHHAKVKGIKDSMDFYWRREP
jgi:hypothetical protein